jgi:hypothetical protein
MQIKRADGELRQPIAPAGTGLLLTGRFQVRVLAREHIYASHQGVSVPAGAPGASPVPCRLCWLVLIMAARSSALGGRRQNRVWARSACPVVRRSGVLPFTVPHAGRCGWRSWW